MGHQVVRLDERRAIATPITPEVAQALRSICYSVRTGDEPEDLKRRMTPAIVAALPATIAAAKADLSPATNGDARKYLAPTLAMLAPVTMTAKDQAVWIAAALETLQGIPADLLEAGCMAARRKVDHPAKIVAAIFAEIGPIWDRRKRELRTVEKLREIEQGTMPARKPWERQAEAVEVATPEQVAGIMAEFGLKGDPPISRPNPGPRRMPTLSDYLALGVSRDIAEAFFTEQAGAQANG